MSITAEDIMNETILSVKEEMSVVQVAHLMLRQKSTSCPVLDDNEQMIGLVTITDLFILVSKLAKGYSTEAHSYVEGNLHDKILQFKDEPIKDFMTRNIISVTPDTKLDQMIDMLIKWKIHTFPVMKDGKLIGIVSRHDLLNAIFSYG